MGGSVDTDITRDGSIALFAMETSIIGLITVMGSWYALTSDKYKFEFIKSNISRTAANTKDLLYRVVENPTLYTVTRQGALLLVAVTSIFIYNIIEYLHSRNPIDLRCSLMSFALYGLFCACRAGIEDYKHSKWGVILGTLAGGMFTIAILLLCELQTGTWNKKSYMFVPYVMICIALVCFITASMLESGAKKVQNKMHMSGKKSMLMSRLMNVKGKKFGFKDAATTTETSWLHDDKTYMVYTLYDLMIIGIPALIFGIIFSLNACLDGGIKNWNASISLFLIPTLFYWVYTMWLFFKVGTQIRGLRIWFNFMLSTSATSTVLILLLHSFDVFHSTRHELIVGVSTYTTLLWFFISIIFKSPNTVPYLSTTCITDNPSSVNDKGTGGDGDECVVVKESINIATGEGDIELTSLPNSKDNSNL